ncbi:Galactokinase [Rothia kristinae]|nr:Galactokinase [Rothia kristinae]
MVRPGRLNLLGEYVDFNGGSALPTPLPYRTLIAARLRTDGVLHAESLQLPGPRNPGSRTSLRARSPGGSATSAASPGP